MKGPIRCRTSNRRIPFLPSAFFFVLLFVGLAPTFTMRSVAAQADFRWVTDVVQGLGNSYLSFYYSWTNTTPLAVDRMGNSYLLSQLFGGITNGTDVLTSRGGSDVLLMRYDRDGNLSWMKRFGGDKNETGVAITLDGAGNGYLVGWSQGSTNADFGQITITNTDTNFLFVAKFDTSGNTIWVNKASGKNFGPLPGGVASDKLGNCYVSGHLGSQITNIASVTITNAKPNNPFLAKYDSIGNIVWVKVPSCSSFLSSINFTEKVVYDDQGSVYWLGEYSGTMSLDGTTLASKTQRDLFWARL